MFSSIIICFIVASILFNKSDGRFHRRNKFVRRQNMQMPPPSNMMQGSYPAQPPQTPIPPAYEIPPKPVISPAFQPPPNTANYQPLPNPANYQPLPNPANYQPPPNPVNYQPNTVNHLPPPNTAYNLPPPNTFNHLPPPNPGNYLPPLPPPANLPVPPSGSAPSPLAYGQDSNSANNPNFGPQVSTVGSQTLATYNPISQNRNANPVPLNKRSNLFQKNSPIDSIKKKNVESPKMLHSYLKPFREHIQRRRKSVSAKKHNSEHGNKVHRNPKPASTKRKTKNVPEKKGEIEKLLEEGRKILEISTESKFMGEDTSSKSHSNLFENNDAVNSNATIIPIPKGIQIKTHLEKDNKHVKETVNITSSTQKTLSIDNNTEIESVVEMEMEKKIEDEKGDSKGSEQVKIIETEHVKPIMIKKGNGLAHKHQKRPFHSRMILKRHRSKRSTTHSASFYRKIMKKFLSDLKRRERTVRMTGLLNRTEITTSGQSDAISKATEKTDWSFKGEKKVSVRDKSVYDSDEIEEFLKQIPAQLIKLRKTRNKSKSRHKHLQYSNPSQKDKDLNFTRHPKKRHDYIEHMEMVINNCQKLLQHLLKSESIPAWSEDISMASELTNTAAFTTQRTITILYLNDKKDTDSRLTVIVIILCVMTFLLPLLLCILPQVYKTSKLKKECSAIKSCPFCLEAENNKGKDRFCRFHSENLKANECLQLEWQSDNGDWLSEKEIEFK